MKKIYAAACVVACCMGNPAGAKDFNEYDHETRWSVVMAAAFCMNTENVWSDSQVVKHLQHAQTHYGVRMTDYSVDKGTQLINDAVRYGGGCKKIVRKGLNSKMDRYVRGTAKPAQLY